jgi:hypothetical protein
MLFWLAIITSSAFASTINCRYIDPQTANVIGKVSAAFDDQALLRDISARSEYEWWSENDNKNIPTYQFLKFPSVINSMLWERKQSLLFSLNNAEADEVVQMKYDQLNDQFVGIRHVSWKADGFGDFDNSIAICKVR